MRRRLIPTASSSSNRPPQQQSPSSSQSNSINNSNPSTKPILNNPLFSSLLKGIFCGILFALLFHLYQPPQQQDVKLDEIPKNVARNNSNVKCELDKNYVGMRERYMTSESNKCKGTGLVFRNGTGFIVDIRGGYSDHDVVISGDDGVVMKRSVKGDDDVRVQVFGVNVGRWVVERGFCKVIVEVIHGGVVNGGFEQVGGGGGGGGAGGGLYAGRVLGYVGGARAWEGFYNGGGKLECGVVNVGEGDDGVFVRGRSGRCFMRFGWERQWGFGGEGIELYYGVHQAVELWSRDWLGKTLVVGVWSLVLKGMEEGRNVGSNSSIVLAWRYADGEVAENFTVQIPTSEEWIHTCALVRPPVDRPIDMLHIYLHATGAHTRAFFDDVTVTPLDELDKQDDFDVEQCYSVRYSREAPEHATYDSLNTSSKIHLSRDEQVKSDALTVAVAVTGDRVARLERLARNYRGPIAACVLISDELELRRFIYLWKRMPYLKQWTSVQFIYEVYSRKNRLMPINAMRNTAVRMIDTEYMVLLDVDMMPGEEGWSCFKTGGNDMLAKLLSGNGMRGLVVPVFIVDVGLQLPKWKRDVIAMLHGRVASPYCWNSQKVGRIDRWYAAEEGYEVRFGKDFEPYVILKRQHWVPYDERFVGYGFNKVSWGWEFEKNGGRLFVLNNAFVTHMNHLDNDWVDQIDDSEYLKTWRRYFAMTTEVDAKHSVIGMDDKV